MKFFIAFTMFVACDVLAFLSVPKPVRVENRWAIFPCGGLILAAEYHFGNKLTSKP